MIYKIVKSTKEEYLEAIKTAGQRIIDTAENMLADFNDGKEGYSIKQIDVSFTVEPMKIQDIQVKKTYMLKSGKEENSNE